MTELQKKIDQEVGQDTENTRVTYLKYVNYGRQLAIEELVTSGAAIFTQKQMDDAVSGAVTLGLESMAQAVQEIMDQAANAATEVEIEEKKRLADLEAMAEQGPIKAEMVAIVKSLILEIDQKHSAIIKDRDQALKALFTK